LRGSLKGIRGKKRTGAEKRDRKAVRKIEGGVRGEGGKGRLY